MRILITDNSRRFEVQLEIIKTRCLNLHEYLVERLSEVAPDFENPMSLKDKAEVVGVVRLVPEELDNVAATVVYIYSTKTEKTSLESLNFNFEVNPSIWDSNDFRLFLEEIDYRSFLNYLEGVPDKSFTKDMREMYNDERYKDSFIVAVDNDNVEQDRFTVHAEFVASRCPALGNALLNPAYKEYSTGEVMVPGTPEAVDVLVKYLYADESIEIGNTFQGFEVELIGLAHMYNLLHLASLYEEFLINNKNQIEEDDVPQLLEIFEQLDVPHVVNALKELEQ